MQPTGCSGASLGAGSALLETNSDRREIGMSEGKITFRSDELSTGPAKAFLAGFSDIVARRVASALIDWAAARGFRFRSGEGAQELTEYIVVPRGTEDRAAEGVPLLTLEQGKTGATGIKGSVHVPFSRLRELGVTTPYSERELFDGLNAALGASRSMGEDSLAPGKNDKNWGIIAYASLQQETVRHRVTATLDQFAADLST
jgi:hypothetical protein